MCLLRVERIRAEARTRPPLISAQDSHRVLSFAPMTAQYVRMCYACGVAKLSCFVVGARLLHLLRSLSPSRSASRLLSGSRACSRTLPQALSLLRARARSFSLCCSIQFRRKVNHRRKISSLHWAGGGGFTQLCPLLRGRYHPYLIKAPWRKRLGRDKRLYRLFVNRSTLDPTSKIMLFR